MSLLDKGARIASRHRTSRVGSIFLLSCVAALGVAEAGCAKKRPAKAPERQHLAEAEGGKCGKISAIELTEAGLLDGRLALMAPKGMADAPSAAPAGESAPSPSEQTRLEIAVEGEKLVVVAEELFQLDPERAELEKDALVKAKSFADDGKAYLESVYASAGALDVGPLTMTHAELHAMSATPKEAKVADGADSALVYATLVSMPDATVQRVSFHVSKGLAAEASCSKYAAYLAKTMTAGARKLERDGGAQSFEALGQKVSVDVPKGYAVVKRAAEGGESWRLVKVRTLGNYQGSFELSIDTRSDAAAAKKGRDTLKRKMLGKKIDFHGERTAKGGWLVATAPLGVLPEGAAAADDAAKAKGKGKGKPARAEKKAKGKPVYLDVTLKAARDGKYLDELLKIAESVSKP